MSTSFEELYKCGNCRNVWAQCMCLDISFEDKEVIEVEEELYKCGNCGNVWDGCAQCMCLDISLEDNEDNEDNEDKEDKINTHNKDYTQSEIILIRDSKKSKNGKYDDVSST